MLVGSHVVLGVAAWVGAAQAFDLPADPMSLGLALLGSVLPDIDHPSSWIGRRGWFASAPIAALCGHRGFTHSVLAVLGGLALLSADGFGGWSVPLVIGYLSHLAGDLVTAGGIPLLWPMKRRFSLNWFRSGSPAEMLFSTALAALLLLSNGGAGM